MDVPLPRLEITELFCVAQSPNLSDSEHLSACTTLAGPSGLSGEVCRDNKKLEGV